MNFIPYTGGIATHLLSLAQSLPEYDFELLTNSYPRVPDEETFLKNLLVRRIGPPDYARYPPPGVGEKLLLAYTAFADGVRTLRIKKRVRESPWALFHFHDMDHTYVRLALALRMGWLDVLGRRIGALPTDRGHSVITVHSSFAPGVDPRLHHWRRWLHLQFRNLICVEPPLKEEVEATFREANLPAKIWYVPNAIDMKRFHPRPKDRAGPLVLGFAGRLEGAKGERFLWGLVEHLPEDVELRLLCSGYPPRIDLLRRRIRNRHVRILDPVPYDQMPDFYNSVDLIINPVQLDYCVTRVTLEALACGVPVVMFPGHRNPLIDRETGFIIPPRIESLQAILEEVRHDPELLRRLGAEGRRRVESPFGLEVFAETMRGIYRQIQETPA